MIEAVEFKKIEMLLGRSISEDANKLLSYKEISDADLNDLRLLAEGGFIDAANYLLYCLDGKGGLRNASSFLDKVVKNGMSLQEWLAQFYTST